MTTNNKNKISAALKALAIFVYISYGATMVIAVEQYALAPLPATVFRIIAWHIVLVFVTAVIWRKI